MFWKRWKPAPEPVAAPEPPVESPDDEGDTDDSPATRIIRVNFRNKAYTDSAGQFMEMLLGKTDVGDRVEVDFGEAD